MSNILVEGLEIKSSNSLCIVVLSCGVFDRLLLPESFFSSWNLLVLLHTSDLLSPQVTIADLQPEAAAAASNERNTGEIQVLLKSASSEMFLLLLVTPLC